MATITTDSFNRPIRDSSLFLSPFSVSPSLNPVDGKVLFHFTFRAGNSSGSSSKTDSTDALWGRRSHVGPQSVHAIANARAQHMLSGLGDLDPEQPSTMPSLLQLHRDINELFKPIKIPELK
ncbi:unnamed protein product [Hymenolepis diminuta]|uniref:Uncharacterized protein n=1 Tax=Hymenolepis diminuta TaxID=6216 RepID=A0A0R3SY55_HYMDI|nr:unnamed protein product [Hymenolepis diminuta]